MNKLALAFILAGIALSGSGCIFVPVDDTPRGGHHHGSYDSHRAPAPRSPPRPTRDPPRR